MRLSYFRLAQLFAQLFAFPLRLDARLERSPGVDESMGGGAPAPRACAKWLAGGGEFCGVNSCV